MYYNFEAEEKQKVLYEYSLGLLPSLNKEELSSVGAVDASHYLHDDEDSNEFAKYLSRLKEKTSNLENITILRSCDSNYTAEVVQQLAACFPYVKTFNIRGWGSDTFRTGAIKSFQYFKNLRTLKIHNYDAKSYFQLQEFGKLTQLKNLIIDYTWPGTFNFESLAFLKEMNLDKIEIEGVISVYNPAVNGEFNASILNNKKLKQKEEAFQKIVSKAAPGNQSSIEAAKGFFIRGMLDKGIEYLYMYGSTENPEQEIPFSLQKSKEYQDILHLEWKNQDLLTKEYFNQRPFLKNLYQDKKIDLNSLHYKY